MAVGAPIAAREPEPRGTVIGAITHPSRCAIDSDRAGRPALREHDQALADPEPLSVDLTRPASSRVDKGRLYPGPAHHGPWRRRPPSVAEAARTSASGARRRCSAVTRRVGPIVDRVARRDGLPQRRATRRTGPAAAGPVRVGQNPMIRRRRTSRSTARTSPGAGRTRRRRAASSPAMSQAAR